MCFQLGHYRRSESAEREPGSFERCKFLLQSLSPLSFATLTDALRETARSFSPGLQRGVFAFMELVGVLLVFGEGTENCNKTQLKEDTVIFGPQLSSF